MAVSALETFIHALRSTSATDQATPENSYLPHLKPLLEAALMGLTPRVAVITHPKKVSGAGLADSGLVEAGSGDLTSAVEAEAPTTSLVFPAASPKGREAWSQAEKYSKQIGPTLLTNFLEFRLVISEGGKMQEVRCVTLGTWKEVFTGNASSLAQTFERDLYDLIRDWATRRRPIEKPSDLASRLADYARLSLKRLEAVPESGLENLKKTLNDALGLHFNAEQGEHFFRSTLIQTLYYGLFSAFVLWVRERNAPAEFRWKDASDYLQLPVISAIFEEVSKVSNLKKLGIREPLEWAESALRRVDADAFFKAFEEAHAIQYFYEPFLEAFDPGLREQLGVWYTPPEVVTYQVRKVHQLLQTELGLADGLADSSVIVLDPATGTGSYVLEVARVIHAHLMQSKPATAAARVKEAMTTRVFGFEILPAPFVVAHMQLGLYFQTHGVQLAAGERFGVYLTNSLTGWNPKDDAKQRLDFPEFQQEKEAAQKVKREAKILVMIGNPPYYRFSAVTQDEQANLIAPYKVGLRTKWKVRKQLLDDLYIRFFRLAEWRVGENLIKSGIVSYISNSSWLEGLSHPVMRESLLKNFDKMWIDNLNGDMRKSGKKTPWKTSDQSIFSSTQDTRGVTVGAAITTFLDKGISEDISKVFFRDFWGLSKDKCFALLEDKKPYEILVPKEETRWVLADFLKKSEEALSEIEEIEKVSVVDKEEDSKYFNWLDITNIFRERFNGAMAARDYIVTDIDRERLERRIKDYFDSSVSDAEMRIRHPSSLDDGYKFVGAIARANLITAKIDLNAFRAITYRPFDERTIYNDPREKLVARHSPYFLPHVFEGNIFLNTTRKQRRKPWDLLTVSQNFTDLHLHEPDMQSFPLYLRVSDMYGTHLEPNIAPATLEAMCKLTGAAYAPRGPHDQTVLETAEALFHHAVAIMQSPAYRSENGGNLSQNWPRIPMPTSKEALEASAALGRRVAALLQPSVNVAGVTHGTLEAGLSGVAIPTMADGTVISAGHALEVTISYGSRGKYIPKGDGSSGDLWWSDVGYWKDVPRAAWEFTIGGYPVLKKWLSYRHVKDLGRPLTLDELEFVTEIVRRILGLLEMRAVLDNNYAFTTAQVVA